MFKIWEGFTKVAIYITYKSKYLLRIIVASKEMLCGLKETTIALTFDLDFISYTKHALLNLSMSKFGNIEGS